MKPLLTAQIDHFKEYIADGFMKICIVIQSLFHLHFSNTFLFVLFLTLSQNLKLYLDWPSHCLGSLSTYNIFIYYFKETWLFFPCYSFLIIFISKYDSDFHCFPFFSLLFYIYQVSFMSGTSADKNTSCQDKGMGI